MRNADSRVVDPEFPDGAHRLIRAVDDYSQWNTIVVLLRFK
jgi:hypothetical protein